MVSIRFSPILALSLAVLFSFTHEVAGQVVGVDICGCQPVTYTLTLDFDLTCEDGVIDGNRAGIEDAACLVSGAGGADPPSDEVPVFVSSIQILELGQDNLNPIFQRDYTDGYTSGSSIQYTSTLAGNPTDNPDAIPKGFQINLSALNAAGQQLEQNVIIVYDNDCGIFPLLFEGDNDGWFVFTDLGAPPLTICPAAPPTEAPSESPSLSAAPSNTLPTLSPSAEPSSSPTESPTAMPSASPSASPVAANTEAPSLAPSMFMSMATDAPFFGGNPPTDDTPTCAPFAFASKAAKAGKKQSGAKKQSSSGSKKGSSSSGSKKGGSSSGSKKGGAGGLTVKGSKSSGSKSSKAFDLFIADPDADCEDPFASTKAAKAPKGAKKNGSGSKKGLGLNAKASKSGSKKGGLLAKSTKGADCIVDDKGGNCEASSKAGKKNGASGSKKDGSSGSKKGSSSGSKKDGSSGSKKGGSSSKSSKAVVDCIVDDKAGDCIASTKGSKKGGLTTKSATSGSKKDSTSSSGSKKNSASSSSGSKKNNLRLS